MKCAAKGSCSIDDVNELYLNMNIYHIKYLGICIKHNHNIEEKIVIEDL